jgi:hypothetical protein|tara:strand:- start:3600 stop:3809 length:210 start_codon:yes stop_codon:yes gene_type:complete
MANEKNYNSMAINMGVIFLIIFILIKTILAIFEFYAISAASLINYILFFVALGMFSVLLPKIRGEVFYK